MLSVFTSRRSVGPCCGALALYGGLAAAAQPVNLIDNGSFEKPASPVGYFTTYSPGQTIGKWTVVGGSGGAGNVATVDSFNEGGVIWSAHQGLAYLDLTGTCDCGAASGVTQTVKTVIGTTYKLTFWVGNTYIAGQGLTSTVDAYVGSTLLLEATNAYGKKSTKEVWKKFSKTFVATTTRTTITFLNGDPSGDQQDGLDSVTLTAE